LQGRARETVDLPRLRLRGIGGHAGQAVAFQPVSLGADQRAGDALRILK
jgi:hypothetical protein